MANLGLLLVVLKTQHTVLQIEMLWLFYGAQHRYSKGSLANPNIKKPPVINLSSERVLDGVAVISIRKK